MTKPKATKSTSTEKPSIANPAVKVEPKPAKKADKLIALLERENGAGLSEITEATGWLPHSARAILTGLRKKGFTLDKKKAEGVTRYRITAEPAA